jgi:hypothetical protein
MEKARNSPAEVPESFFLPLEELIVRRTSSGMA